MARLLSGSGTVTGTGALTSIAPGADGQVLTSTGSVWNSEAAAGGGKVLQVESLHFDGTWSTTGTTYTDVTGFTKNITPASGTKILILINLASGGTSFNHFQLLRDSTVIGDATAAGSRRIGMLNTGQFPTGSTYLKSLSFNYLDTHGADGSTEITYKLQGQNENGATTYLGRTERDLNSSVADARAPSSMTLMEIDS